jgi:hypothetical protein
MHKGGEKYSEGVNFLRKGELNKKTLKIKKPKPVFSLGAIPPSSRPKPFLSLG